MTAFQPRNTWIDACGWPPYEKGAAGRPFPLVRVGLLRSVDVIVARCRGAQRAGQWQQLAEEAVPAGNACGGREHHVARLHVEAVGQCEGGRRFQVELINGRALRLLATLVECSTHDVDH